MNSDENTPTFLEDVKINVKIKLSALWATLMFLYLYLDFFKLYEPGSIEEILAGRVWEFEITQAWALSAMVLMTIPSLMVFLSMALPAKANRLTNIILGALYVVVGIGTMIGETWVFYIFGHSLGIILLLLIVWHAWNWPKQEA
ncbi:hypothetical protein J7W08_05505 [Methanococcoides orientis]|uniref:DUF6326 family protein n=1 Tax=Methanococcoides orientis TaxID=2822137 RepID=UPI001E3FE5A3|nr:DUF6326 family protein [Methanococcoides orientis]UGV41732.1 hypothetical protein J7W08_05505 [Methanococcoides orientis]